MFPLFAVTGFCRKLECTHSRALCSVGGDTRGTLGVFRDERQLPTHQFCLHSSPSRTSPESATGGDLKRWAEQGTHLSPSPPCAPWWEGPWLGPQDSTFRISSHPSIASSPINHGTVTVRLLRLVTSQMQSQASRQGLRACQTQSPEKQRRTEIFRKKKK